jgi:hypothetical protein
MRSERGIDAPPFDISKWRDLYSTDGRRANLPEWPVRRSRMRAVAFVVAVATTLALHAASACAQKAGDPAGAIADIYRAY